MHRVIFSSINIVQQEFNSALSDEDNLIAHTAYCRTGSRMTSTALTQFI